MEEALNHVQKLWGAPIFLGPQPISIEYRHFDQLKQKRYIVCEKTDGIRKVLVCLTVDGKKISTFINRALETDNVKLQFGKSVFDGSVFDGELCEDNVFMVYDAFQVCGEYMGSLHFLDRYVKIEKALKTLLVMKNDVVKIKLKRFFPLFEFQKFRDDYLPTVAQKMDGLIFTPIDEPVKQGTHETMFKWKPREKNTIDFQMKDAGSSWRLYIQEKGQLMYESEFPKTLMNEPWFANDIIVECQYMTEDTPLWWKPILHRRDKKHANNRRTFYRTLINIKEDIKLDEFLKCT